MASNGEKSAEQAAEQADGHADRASQLYVGRFAPSPTGPLHFGSLLAALASFLDARSRQGRWLVRMEDLDRAREFPGAANSILSTLEAFQLHWDGDVLFQSRRFEAYQYALEYLRGKGLLYPCNCPRQRMQSLRGLYDGHCRQHPPAPEDSCAVRIKVPNEVWSFQDRIQGTCEQNLARDCGDFVLYRRDNVPAYQLAVAVDDDWQNITHIVRGYDLLDSTPRQLYLQNALEISQPVYAHIPLASSDSGQKLSKQNLARPLDAANAGESLYQALKFLGQQPPGALRHEAPATQIAWAISHWDIQTVPKLATIPVGPVLV